MFACSLPSKPVLLYCRVKLTPLMRGMEEAPENGKESSHSAHANGMNKYK
jgi:hypothetical protein